MSKDTDNAFFKLRDVRGCLDISLRDRIRFLLMLKNIGQNELARKCGVSKATMSSIVSGEWIPSSVVKLKMAEVLEVDTLVIFGACEYWLEWRDKIGYPKGVENESS